MYNYLLNTPSWLFNDVHFNRFGAKRYFNFDPTASAIMAFCKSGIQYTLYSMYVWRSNRRRYPAHIPYPAICAHALIMCAIATSVIPYPFIRGQWPCGHALNALDFRGTRDRVLLGVRVGGLAERKLVNIYGC